MTNTEIRKRIEAEGLVFLGVTAPEYRADYARFLDWISERRHADLAYLERNTELRAEPTRLLPGTRSVVVVGLPYFVEEKTDGPGVALYARYRDYHDFLREKMARAAAGSFVSGEYRVTVDSAPLLERALAARTSRGFIGKNTLYIHPDYGSFLLLGEILTTQQLIPDQPPDLPLDRKTKEGGCGPCKRCQVSCPTAALDRDYQIDASRCLSYWTIENRSTIPERFWPWLAQYYFGCDLCQLACPYNLRAKGPPTDWQRRKYPGIDGVALLNQTEYETYFGGTPMTRAKRSGLRRNALIAMAVTGHARLDEALDRVKEDGDQMLRQTVVQIRNYVATKRALSG